MFTLRPPNGGFSAEATVEPLFEPPQRPAAEPVDEAVAVAVEAAAAAAAAAGPSAGEDDVAVPSAATVARRGAEPVEEEPLPPAVVEEKVAGSGE